MRVISDLLNALARRSERIRQGGKRSKLGKLFFRLFLFFTSVAIIMEVFDLHVLGKTRALTTRIAVGFGMVTSLVMIWLLSGDNLFSFSDEQSRNDKNPDE